MENIKVSPESLVTHSSTQTPWDTLVLSTQSVTPLLTFSSLTLKPFSPGAHPGPPTALQISIRSAPHPTSHVHTAAHPYLPSLCS